MATQEKTGLSVTPREVSGSRAVRRLRRSGLVPGIVYGGGEEPLAFQVDARDLRHVLAAAGSVIDLQVDGGGGTPVVLKDLARHPVNGETMHVDLLRVRLDRAIQSTVVLDLTGVEEAPGVKQGGVLEQVTRELTIEALPGDIPDTIQLDVSTLDVGDTLTTSAVIPPQGVTLVDDPDTVVATVTAPRLQLEDENEIEQETEIVGEGEEPPGEEDSGGTPGGEAADTTSE